MLRFFQNKDAAPSEIIQQFIELEKCQVPYAWLAHAFGVTRTVHDAARYAYYHPEEKSYLLIRTFKAGVSNGIETELSFLRNHPEFIFANPSTVISVNIPSKTISHLPDSEWYHQPSLLFLTTFGTDTTIANYGIASVNSFSSTDAMNLMRKLAALKNAPDDRALTLSQKFANLYCFLCKNWREKIDAVKSQIDALEPVFVDTMKSVSDKTFMKKFNLYFHKHPKYDELIICLENLAEYLNQANQLHNIFNDVVINEEGSVFSLKEEIAKLYTSKKGEQKDVVKELLFKATEMLKANPPDNISHHPDEIYKAYCDYLEMGARHNELVSRIYPWEIVGIEWGGDDLEKINAVADLILILQDRKDIYDSLMESGFNDPLFKDFILNRLSVESPWLTYSQLTDLYADITENNVTYLSGILNHVKEQLMKPIFVYEYSVKNREIINISNLIASRSSSRYRQEIEHYVSLFDQGIRLYAHRHHHKVTILPRSGIKKRAHSLDMFDVTVFRKYWEKNEEVHPSALLKILSRVIINQPYVDEKRELLDSNKKVIYRPNHDVMHAIRQMIFVDYIMESFKKHKVNRWVQVIDSYTAEELACVKLGAFLCRSGRTNEKDSREDPSNLVRSANIFRLVAQQLQFNPNLIEIIANHIAMFQEVDDYSQSVTNNFMEYDKVIFAKALINISHDADLVRCHSWCSYFATRECYAQAKLNNPQLKNFYYFLLDKINLLVSSQPLAEEMLNELLLFAKMSCELTGTPVKYDGFSSDQKVENYELPMRDDKLLAIMPFDARSKKLKDIKSFWTDHVAECIKACDELKKQCLSSELSLKKWSLS